MIPVLDTNAWIEKLRELERPGADNILAVYEHRIGAICRDPRLMLAPLDDHLVHRGDGVFETIRFTERKVIHLDAHLRRLANSAAGLSLTLPCPIEEIRDIVLAVAKAGDEPEGNIRILSGRGPGGFGIALKECPQSSLYVAAYRVPVRTDAWYDKGLTAFRSDVPVKPAMFARLKTTNYLSAVFMTLEAMQKHMDVALTFDANDCLTEAAIANVAVVDAKGALVLPEFKNALVGTVATKAMELAKTFMPVEIRPIPQAELDSVREMMILGTAHECIGVTHFEGRPIGDGKTGPVAHKLRKLIREDLLAGGEAFERRGRDCENAEGEGDLALERSPLPLRASPTHSKDFRAYRIPVRSVPRWQKTGRAVLAGLVFLDSTPIQDSAPIQCLFSKIHTCRNSLKHTPLF